jgi:hypothetical protein
LEIRRERLRAEMPVCSSEGERRFVAATAAETAGETSLSVASSSCAARLPARKPHEFCFIRIDCEGRLI